MGEPEEFDDDYNFFDDTPAGQDPDRRSRTLRQYHRLLWSKPLPDGRPFELHAGRAFSPYLVSEADGMSFVLGSDAITSSYTGWSRRRSKSLADAITALDEDQRSRYLNPPYTIGSAMIWPVRTKDRPTMNTARGLRLSIADRMDLTLECIRRHYAGEPESPLADVITAYADFFALFGGFREFVDFFHFQDLVTPDYDEVRFYLPFDNFKRSGTPTTTEEYVTYREATLEFIEKRGRRMAEWVMKHPPRDEVRQ